MSEAIAYGPKPPQWKASKALTRGATSWFVIAAIGQWIFLAYILVFYGSAVVQGNLAAWNENLSGGYVPGETAGNLAAASHLVFALIILAGGTLQLIPQVRNRFPVFHRWTGRMYILSLLLTAVVGLFMLFARDIGEVYLKVGFILQAVLIFWFSANAFRYARARDFRVHRRWALRLFLVASAVWFYRVMLMIWVMTTGGVGVDFSTGKGPFLDFMAFGQYLPLLVLEAYFYAKRAAGRKTQYIMAAFLFFASAATAAGIALATIGMWFPPS